MAEKLQNICSVYW